MWLQEIGLMWSLGHWDLASLLSITSLEMRNLAEIRSNCGGAEKLLTPQIHQNPFFFLCSTIGWQSVLGERAVLVSLPAPQVCSCRGMP